jgi:oxygen-dependent protoporphyrinogen oxidase
VVLALPARPASRLLSDVDSTVSTVVGQLDYASVALVTMALPGVDLPELSGFLVPAEAGYAVKAVTFFGHKWTHHRRSGVCVVRASIGRYGDERLLQRPDAELISTVHAELGQLLGPLPVPVDSRVHRWGGALPQYAPGHLDRVAAARGALPGTLTLAGAGYDGVGIPTCVRSGQAAAEHVVAHLGQSSA